MRTVKVALCLGLLVAIGLVAPRVLAYFSLEKKYFLEDGLIGYHTMRKGTEIVQGRSEWWDPHTGFRTCLQYTRYDETEFEITFWSSDGVLIRQEIQSENGVQVAEGPPWLWRSKDQKNPNAPWLKEGLPPFEWFEMIQSRSL